MVRYFPINSARVIRPRYRAENLSLAFPLDHTLTFDKTGNTLHYILIGPNGSGKTTLLRSLEDDILYFKSFQNHQENVEVKDQEQPKKWGNNFTHLAEYYRQVELRKWGHQEYYKDKRELGEYNPAQLLLRRFMGVDFFGSDAFNSLFDGISSKKLVARIRRGCESIRVKELIEEAKSIATGRGFDEISMLRRLTFLVESGFSLFNSSIPEAMFEYYALKFNPKINPRSLEGEYVTPKVNYAPKSQGQGVIADINDLVERSTDNSFFLVDELTNRLDPKARKEVINLLDRFGAPFILATNDEVVIEGMKKGGTGIISLYDNPASVSITKK